MRRAARASASRSSRSEKAILSRTVSAKAAGVFALPFPNHVTQQLSDVPLQSSDDMLFAMQLVTTLLASQLLDMVGRVKPLAVSVTVCSGSMVALGSIIFAFSTPDESLDSALGQDFTSACKVRLQ